MKRGTVIYPAFKGRARGRYVVDQKHEVESTAVVKAEGSSTLSLEEKLFCFLQPKRP
jgi:hypothetical protein